MEVCGGYERNTPDVDRLSLPDGWADLQDSERALDLSGRGRKYWEGVLGEGRAPYFQYGSAIRLLEGHP